MGRRGYSPARQEVTEKVSESHDEMTEKGDQLEDNTVDVETARRTLERLEQGGTVEGTEEVEQSIEGAENVSLEEFEGSDDELEDMHEENQEIEREYHERSESSGRDTELISEAITEVKSENARGELEEAKSAAEDDGEFLAEHEQKAVDFHKESDLKQNELRLRVGRRI